MIYEISMNKGSFLPCDLESGEMSLDSMNLVVMASNELKQLGYIFSSELFNYLCGVNSEALKPILVKAIDTCKKITGANKKFKPFYPNFPNQVIEMEEAELYFNAYIHYLSIAEGFDCRPHYRKTRRPKIEIEEKDLKIIKKGTFQDFTNLIEKMIQSNNVYTPQEKEYIEYYSKSFDMKELLDFDFSIKENICFLVALNFDYASKLLKTATDVLRVASFMCNGDITLKKINSFFKMNRKVRKTFMNILEKNDNLAEDMKRHKINWLKLAKTLHVGEYHKTHPKTFAAINMLRNDIKSIETYNSVVEKMFETNDINVLNKLTERPGVFARSLNRLLMVFSNNHKEVLSKFNVVMRNIPNKILLELIIYFKNRNKLDDSRIFFLKGETTKAKIIENNLSTINESTIVNIVTMIENEIVSRYNVDNFNHKNVFIDESMKDIILPFATRSSSKGMLDLTKGSKISFDKNVNTLRFFIWWENFMDGKCEQRVDVDLSAFLLTEDFKVANHLSYYNLRNYGGHHSGDITNAPIKNGGACEFIDIDISKTSSRYRYVGMVVHCFNGITFNKLNCFVGWMGRKKANSGQVFEPSTIKQKIELNCESISHNPVLFDLKERKAIWLDIPSNSYARNLIGSSGEVKSMYEVFFNLKKMDMYSFMSYICRGSCSNIVKTKEEADIIIDIEHGIKPEDYGISI